MWPYLNFCGHLLPSRGPAAKGVCKSRYKPAGALPSCSGTWGQQRPSILFRTLEVTGGICMFITVGPVKRCERVGEDLGEREKGGHVLEDTTSRGLCVRVRPPHTIERRGGGGGCEQGGWQGGEGHARRSGQEERQRHIRRC